MTEWGAVNVMDYPNLDAWRFGFWILLKRNGHSKWLYAKDGPKSEVTKENLDEFMQKSEKWAA